MLRFRLQSKSLPAAGRRLAKAAVCILAESIEDQNILFDLDLVLTEACANVVRHAYEGSPEGDLEIVLGIEPRSFVEIEVADWGKRFDKGGGVTNPAPSSESGRGLFIISQLVDSTERRVEGDKNTFIFRKRIREDLWKTCA